MDIKSLFKGIDYEIKGEQKGINNLQQKSSDVVDAGLFFCYKGVNFDGKDKIYEAIQNGCVAVCVDEFLDVDICQIKVVGVRKIIAKVCSNFYNNPDKKLKIIGITGTNGKTTTSYIIRNILHSCGKSRGYWNKCCIYWGDL